MNERRDKLFNFTLRYQIFLISQIHFSNFKGRNPKNQLCHFLKRFQKDCKSFIQQKRQLLKFKTKHQKLHSDNDRQHNHVIMKVFIKSKFSYLNLKLNSLNEIQSIPLHMKIKIFSSLNLMNPQKKHSPESIIQNQITQVSYNVLEKKKKFQRHKD